MKKYRISKELKHYIRRTLFASFRPCKITTDANGQLWCETNASSNTFHKVVQRAKCEKRSKEDGVFYVTAKEAASPTLLDTMLRQRGITSYQVIDDRDGTRRLKTN